MKTSILFKNIIKLFVTPKMVTVFFLGFASGLPLLLTMSTLSMWISREGIDNKTIGLFALIGLPYSFKFLWSFLFDYFELPYLTKKLGRRTSWLIIIQILLIFSIICLGTTDPKVDITFTAIFALLVSFFSASQDILIDAYRIEMLAENEQASGSAMTTYGYRIAMIVSGAGSLFLADKLGNWHDVYFIMAAISSIGIFTVLLNKEKSYKKQGKDLNNIFIEIIIAPFLDFMKKQKWFAILLFIMLFKLPDSIISSMMSKFYVSMGFSNTEIALVVKSFGFIMTMIGIFIGGLMYHHFGTFKTLLISVIILPLSNLLFILQVIYGHNIDMLYFIIAIENLSGSLSTVVCVAYLANICSKQYTATQFALLSSLTAVGRTFFASSGGYIVESMGWSNFFIISCLCGIPAIIILYYITEAQIFKKALNTKK